MLAWINHTLENDSDGSHRHCRPNDDDDDDDDDTIHINSACTILTQERTVNYNQMKSGIGRHY